MMVEWMTSRVR